MAWILPCAATRRNASMHTQLLQGLLRGIACFVILGERLAKRSQILCVLDSLEDIIAHEVRGRSAIVLCTSADGSRLIVRQFCLHLCHQPSFRMVGRAGQ